MRPLRAREGVTCPVYICGSGSVCCVALGTYNPLSDLQVPLEFLVFSLVLFLEVTWALKPPLREFSVYGQTAGWTRYPHPPGSTPSGYVEAQRHPHDPENTHTSSWACPCLQAQGQVRPSWARPCLHVRRPDATCQGGPQLVRACSCVPRRQIMCALGRGRQP